MITKTQYIELMKQYRLIPYSCEFGTDYGIKNLSNGQIEYIFGYRDEKPKNSIFNIVEWADGSIVSYKRGCVSDYTDNLDEVHNFIKEKLLNFKNKEILYKKAAIEKDFE